MITLISTIVSIAAGIFLILYWCFTRNFNYWKNQNVPYNKPTFLFGNIYSVVAQQKSINEFLVNLYRSTASPYIGFFAFDRPIMLIRTPELIKKILVNDFDYFEDRSVMYNKQDKYCKGVLFLMKQPEWKTLRAKVTSVFAYGKIKKMVPLVLEAGDDLTGFLQNKCLHSEKINCRTFSIKYAVDVIASCAFGLRTNSHTNSKFLKAAKGVQDVTPLRVIQSAAHFFAPYLVPLFRMKFFHPASGQYLEKVVLEAMSERKKLKINRPDLIELMIKFQKQEPQYFDDALLVGLSLQYLVAGYETSGATIAYALYELSLNLSIQDRLRNEIVSTLEKHKTITYNAIQEIEYLDMVIKETLRKYPPLPFLDRTCTKTYTIPDTGVVIKKGMAVYLSLTALQHDENYFSNPMEFNPERFSAKNKLSILPYTYMPFGEGYRNCIANKFGQLSVSVALIKILVDFEVLPSTDTPKTISFQSNGFLLTPTNDEILLKFISLKT